MRSEGALKKLAEAGSWRRFGASGIVLLAGILATLTTFHALRSAEISDSKRRFSSWTSERRDVLQKEVDAGVYVLLGVRALFDSSEFVSANEFERYTAEVAPKFPHIYSLEWLPHVSHERRAEFEASSSKQLGIDYRIRQRLPDSRIVTAATRPEYWPIYYVQARDGIARLGIDANLRPANARAMRAAIRTNGATASRVNVAPVGTDAAERIFVFLPVFGHPSGNVAGFVRSSVNVDELIASTMREAAREGIAIELVDPADQHVLGSTVRTAHASPDASPLDRYLSWKGQVRIADLALDLNFYSTEQYVDHPDLAPLYLLLLAGIVASALGAVAAHTLTLRRLHLQHLTRELLEEVAERRNSEQRLSQSEARYRVLVENSPDAILLHYHGQIAFANGACARLLRAATPESLIGRSVYDFLGSDHHELVRNRVRTMVERHVILPPLEHTLIRTDGSRVDVEVLAVPFDTDEGVVIQVTARDITQRRADEMEQHKLEAALRHSQKLEALGTLAGGIAHDFNNILSAIIGNTRLLFEDLQQTHPAWRSVREILNAAHRARDLVKRVTAFSSQQESQRTAVAVAPLVLELQQLLRATLPAGVELTVTTPPDIPPVLGDATQIHQVLMNLCTNAWQSLSDNRGRIEITVATLDADVARTQVATPLQGAKRYVCFGVHDNGCGILPEVSEHIFEPFFTTKSVGEGSGLGLAVVHGIVQSHKGAIDVKSRPGQGTAFFIYLPVCEESPTLTQPVLRADTRGTKQHVLYIDDEEPLVFLVVRTLERAGYRCTGTQDPAAAIELVRHSPASFDFVVTDLNMPGMSGLDVARELLAISPDLPIIIATGYIKAADVAAARKLGVKDVVLKPDTIEELAATVQAHLQRATVIG